MAVVDTPKRFRMFVVWLLAFLAIHAGLALLHFHGQVEIPAMNPVFDSHLNKETGEAVTVTRMCGVGLFGNPNDLSRILVVGIALTIYLMGQWPRALLPGLLGLAGMFGVLLDSDALSRRAGCPRRHPADRLATPVRRKADMHTCPARPARRAGLPRRTADGPVGRRRDRATAHSTLAGGIHRPPCIARIWNWRQRVFGDHGRPRGPQFVRRELMSNSGCSAARASCRRVRPGIVAHVSASTRPGARAAAVPCRDLSHRAGRCRRVRGRDACRRLATT